MLKPLSATSARLIFPGSGWGERRRHAEGDPSRDHQDCKITGSRTQSGDDRISYWRSRIHEASGVKADVDLALKSISEAARRNYLPAQAIVHVWHAAHSREVEIDEETQLDWLYNACLWKQITRTPVLRRKNLTVYEDARKEFHARVEVTTSISMTTNRHHISTRRSSFGICNQKHTNPMLSIWLICFNRLLSMRTLCVGTVHIGEWGGGFESM